jgi:hypothetical protein
LGSEYLSRLSKTNYFSIRDRQLDENDIESLDRLRGNIIDSYSKGKLNENQYESLRNEISTLYEEIFRKRINALNKTIHLTIKLHKNNWLR